ncbi:hypothetical protein MC885_018274, partial [Smutsia gigantea]
QLLSQSRRERKNHTSKLQELALLLPVALKIGSKKLTKGRRRFCCTSCTTFSTSREALMAGLEPSFGPSETETFYPISLPILSKVLSLGSLPETSEEETADRRIRYKLSVAADRQQSQAPNPSNTHPSALSERQTQAQNPRCSPALDKPKKWVAPCPGQQGGTVGGPTAPERGPAPSSYPKAVSSAPQGDRKGGGSQLAWLDTAEDSTHSDISISRVEGGTGISAPLVWGCGSQNRGEGKASSEDLETSFEAARCPRDSPLLCQPEKA